MNKAFLKTKKLMEKYANLKNNLFLDQNINTYSNPVGYYAKALVKFKLGLKDKTNKKEYGYDALYKDKKYLIKSRWEYNEDNINNTRELGPISWKNVKRFDVLIGIIFAETFDVKYAVKIPAEDIKSLFKEKYINEPFDERNFVKIKLLNDMIDKYDITDEFE